MTLHLIVEDVYSSIASDTFLRKYSRLNIEQVQFQFQFFHNTTESYLGCFNNVYFQAILTSPAPAPTQAKLS